MKNMKTLSKTLLVSVAAAVVAVNVYCNDAGAADSGAKTEVYSPASAYINVRGPVNEQAMLEAIQSDIVRIKQQAGKLDAEILRLRIDMGDSPLAVHAPAETR